MREKINMDKPTKEDINHIVKMFRATTDCEQRHSKIIELGFTEEETHFILSGILIGEKVMLSFIEDEFANLGVKPEEIRNIK